MVKRLLSPVGVPALIRSIKVIRFVVRPDHWSGSTEAHNKWFNCVAVETTRKMSGALLPQESRLGHPFQRSAPFSIDAPLPTPTYIHNALLYVVGSFRCCVRKKRRWRGQAVLMLWFMFIAGVGMLSTLFLSVAHQIWPSHLLCASDADRPDPQHTLLDGATYVYWGEWMNQELNHAQQRPKE